MTTSNFKETETTSMKGGDAQAAAGPPGHENGGDLDAAIEKIIDRMARSLWAGGMSFAAITDTLRLTADAVIAVQSQAIDAAHAALVKENERLNALHEMDVKERELGNAMAIITYDALRSRVEELEAQLTAARNAQAETSVEIEHLQLNIDRYRKMWTRAKAHLSAARGALETQRMAYNMLFRPCISCGIDESIDGNKTHNSGCHLFDWDVKFGEAFNREALDAAPAQEQQGDMLECAIDEARILQQQLDAARADCAAYVKAKDEIRDAILNGRGPLADYDVDGDHINAVLGIIDDLWPEAERHGQALTEKLARLEAFVEKFIRIHKDGLPHPLGDEAIAIVGGKDGE